MEQQQLQLQQQLLQQHDHVVYLIHIIQRWHHLIRCVHRLVVEVSVLKLDDELLLPEQPYNVSAPQVAATSSGASRFPSDVNNGAT